MFYIKVKNIETRSRLINELKMHDIIAVFHYIPLHSSPAGKRFGCFHGTDRWTTKESERLVRLPLYFGMSDGERGIVVDAVIDFFRNERANANGREGR
jgi:dTDP-4-amino-4,6-dideoxygalactose transaminase